MVKKIGLLVAVLALFHASFWPGSGKDFVDITVVEGATAHSVADQLRESDLVLSNIPFLAWIKLRRADQKIAIGRYRFSRGRSAYWIVDDLIQGRTLKAKLIIPEGFSSWQIAERLEDLEICRANEFKTVVKEKSLEGYLFPATYDMDFGLSAEAVARKLKAQFESQWPAEFDTRAKEIGFSKKDTVTFASIIEREVRVRDELAVVSSVYHNRLRIGMRLEADPTVQFAMGYWKSRLLNRDYKETKSPYNTYLNKGLPPGPICNPGLDALRAALWPASTEFLYFVAQDDGRHNFSKTYREHLGKVNARNRRKRA